MPAERELCELSDITKDFCHHCRTGMRTLGEVRDLLGFGADEPEAA